MRLLLDTQVWLWLIADPDRLSEEARQMVTDPDTDLLLSAAAVWEIGIKHAAGKLKYVGNPSVLVPVQIERSGVSPLNVTVDHALTASGLPMHHRDPFDRVMIAQARLEELTFVTRDSRLSAYDVEVALA